MKFQYNGSDERVIPSLGITVKQGDTFDAPDDFAAHEVSSAGKAEPAKQKVSE